MAPLRPPLPLLFWALSLAAATGVLAFELQGPQNSAADVAAHVPGEEGAAVAAEDGECADDGVGGCALGLMQMRRRIVQDVDSESNGGKRSIGAPVSVVDEDWKADPEELQMTKAAGESEEDDADGCFSRPFSGQMTGSQLCFCQLARNSACADKPCACPQGCDGTADFRGFTTIFPNKVAATGCKDNTVLLTSPRGYYQDPKDLVVASGGKCKLKVVERLLVDGFNEYQQKVQSGPVWQCFHGYHIASVKYLHLQTFCHSGQFHGMPTKNKYVAACVPMSSTDEAPRLAQQLATMFL